jgi:hypothetical protein
MALGSVVIIFGAGASFDSVALPVEQVVTEARVSRTARY